MKEYFKKLSSYFLSGLVAVILIGGCITPAYYSHEQDISLTIPEGATAEMDGKPLEKRGDTVHTTVDRSWRDKEIIVKKEGYKDEKVKLKSVATKDKWAGEGFGSGHSSASMLFVPVHTAISAGAVVASPVVAVGGAVSNEPEVLAMAPAIGAAGLLSLPFSIGMDLFNIFIGAPSTAIKNPWREYEYNGILRNMEPIENNTSQYPPIQK